MNILINIRIFNQLKVLTGFTKNDLYLKKRVAKEQKMLFTDTVGCYFYNKLMNVSFVK